MAKKDQKTKSYTVRTPMRVGVPGDGGEPEFVDIAPGEQVDLTDQEAWDCRHAIEDGPTAPPKATTADGQTEEVDEETEEALDSIRRRPDNPDSGVMLYWKTDIAAQRAALARPTKTLQTGGKGFERLNEASGINDPMLGGPFPPRPEANKTEMEREEEEANRNAQAKQHKAAAKAEGEKKSA